MSLSKHIDAVRANIKAGRYGNEAAVSQGIVLRLLQVLGWPTYDTQVVCPEFSLGGRRVDYALCHPPNKPAAFIEVKQIGQSDGTERQLFEYAFHVGVPLAILTDGQEWNFFLPAEQGDYSERRVYKLDIVERDLPESVARLERYLSYGQTTAGAAIAAAREDYRNVSRGRQVLATLPEAWSKLVADEDELLLELVADKVESMCGFKPDVDTVAKFLRENISLKIGPVAVRPSSATPQRAATVPTLPAPANTPTTLPSKSVNAGSTGFTIQGRFVPARNGREVLVAAFEALADRDTTFLERFAARPKHGRTRRYLARSPEELYPGRPDLAREFFTKLRSGWFLGTNVSHAAVRQIVEMACEVADLRYGADVIVRIGE